MPIFEPSTKDEFCRVRLAGMTDLAPTNRWCNQDGRKYDPADCNQHFRTGTSGHVQRCRHNGYQGAAAKCALSSSLIQCCDHFCAQLKQKTEINPNTTRLQIRNFLEFAPAEKP